MAQTKPKAGQFYGVSDNGTDGQFLKADGTGGMSWVSTIVDPTITSIDYPGTQTAADPAGGESVIINGTLFASGVTCTVGGTSAVTAFNSATQITITTPAKAAGQYTVAVTNTDGGTASQANFIQYSGVPVWSTAAGSLGNVLEGTAASFQVTATEGSDTIEYAVTTGTLPTGLSLATATGAITGTAPTVSADTTTTFSITATDDENQTSSSRSFSITVQNDNPSNYFNTVLYTGNGSTDRNITGVGFDPDLTIVKSRSGGENWGAGDTVRGGGFLIYPNLSNAEVTANAYITPSAVSDGFNISTGNNNSSGNNYVAWNFKAGGAAVSNTDGTITSQVSVNNTLGFSIAKYAGNAISGATYGHGLDAAPELVLNKVLNYNQSWWAFTPTLGANKFMQLNTNAGTTTDSDYYYSVSSSLFTLNGPGYPPALNQSGKNYITYNFTSKPGFSKVGSYTGTGAQGNNILLDFEPAFVMIKSTLAGANWIIVDNKRNNAGEWLYPNVADAAFNGSAYTQFYANGFSVSGTASYVNGSATTYLYLAFAADPSTTTPSLANSFATEIYTGNGSKGHSINTVGFKPDFTWIKTRTDIGGSNHFLFDSIRGATNRIFSNLTNGEAADLDSLVSFDSNGFTVDDDISCNGSGQSIVAWNWKAGGLASINTDGSITSVVSANQAAGFSVVKYNGNSNSGTVGHGLSQTPELFFIKTLSMSAQWLAINTSSQTGGYLSLTDSFTTTRYDAWLNNANPTNTIIPLGAYNYVSGDMIMYCFTSIAGYSKVGTYSGNGTLGHSIATGFAPSFVIIKMTSASGSWYMFDNARTTGVYSDQLIANSNGAEATGTYVELTSTGFTLATTGSDLNNNNQTYIYLAIKEN